MVVTDAFGCLLVDERHYTWLFACIQPEQTCLLSFRLNYVAVVVNFERTTRSQQQGLAIVRSEDFKNPAGLWTRWDWRIDVQKNLTSIAMLCRFSRLRRISAEMRQSKPVFKHFHSLRQCNFSLRDLRWGHFCGEMGRIRAKLVVTHLSQIMFCSGYLNLLCDFSDCCDFFSWFKLLR